MLPEEMDQRTERFRTLQMEMADPLAALQAFSMKMAMLTPALERARRGVNAVEDLSCLRDLARLYRNHADDYLRVGNLLRRAADQIEPVLDEMGRRCQ